MVDVKPAVGGAAVAAGGAVEPERAAAVLDDVEAGSVVLHGLDDEFLTDVEDRRAGEVDGVELGDERVARADGELLAGDIERREGDRLDRAAAASDAVDGERGISTDVEGVAEGVSTVGRIVGTIDADIELALHQGDGRRAEEVARGVDEAVRSEGRRHRVRLNGVGHDDQAAGGSIGLPRRRDDAVVTEVQEAAKAAFQKGSRTGDTPGQRQPRIGTVIGGRIGQVDADKARRAEIGGTGETHAITHASSRVSDREDLPLVARRAVERQAAGEADGLGVTRRTDAIKVETTEDDPRGETKGVGEGDVVIGTQVDLDVQAAHHDGTVQAARGARVVVRPGGTQLEAASIDVDVARETGLVRVHGHTAVTRLDDVARDDLAARGGVRRVADDQPRTGDGDERVGRRAGRAELESRVDGDLGLVATVRDQAAATDDEFLGAVGRRIIRSRRAAVGVQTQRPHVDGGARGNRHGGLSVEDRARRAAGDRSGDGSRVRKHAEAGVDEAVGAVIQELHVPVVIQVRSDHAVGEAARDVRELGRQVGARHRDAFEITEPSAVRRLDREHRAGVTGQAGQVELDEAAGVGRLRGQEGVTGEGDVAHDFAEIDGRVTVDAESRAVQVDRGRVAPAALGVGRQVEAAIQAQQGTGALDDIGRRDADEGAARAAGDQGAEVLVGRGRHRAAEFQQAVGVDQRVAGVVLGGVEHHVALRTVDGIDPRVVEQVHRRAADDEGSSLRERSRAVGQDVGRTARQADVEEAGGLGARGAAQAVDERRAEGIRDRVGRRAEVVCRRAGADGGRTDVGAVDAGGVVRAGTVGGRTKEPGTITELGEIEGLVIGLIVDADRTATDPGSGPDATGDRSGGLRGTDAETGHGLVAAEADRAEITVLGTHVDALGAVEVRRAIEAQERIRADRDVGGGELGRVAEDARVAEEGAEIRGTLEEHGAARVGRDGVEEDFATADLQERAVAAELAADRGGVIVGRVVRTLLHRDAVQQLDGVTVGALRRQETGAVGAAEIELLELDRLIGGSRKRTQVERLIIRRIEEERVALSELRADGEDGVLERLQHLRVAKVITVVLDVQRRVVEDKAVRSERIRTAVLQAGFDRALHDAERAHAAGGRADRAVAGVGEVEIVGTDLGERLARGGDAPRDDGRLRGVDHRVLVERSQTGDEDARGGAREGDDRGADGEVVDGLPRDGVRRRKRAGGVGRTVVVEGGYGHVVTGTGSLDDRRDIGEDLAGGEGVVELEIAARERDRAGTEGIDAGGDQLALRGVDATSGAGDGARVDGRAAGVVVTTVEGERAVAGLGQTDIARKAAAEGGRLVADGDREGLRRTAAVGHETGTGETADGQVQAREVEGAGIESGDGDETAVGDAGLAGERKGAFVDRQRTEKRGRRGHDVGGAAQQQGSRTRLGEVGRGEVAG